MERKNEYITIKEAKRRSHIVSMTYKTKINKINLVVGLVFVGCGVVTLPLPCGSIIMICGGVGLCFNPVPISKIIKNLCSDIRFRVGCWL